MPLDTPKQPVLGILEELPMDRPFWVDHVHLATHAAAQTPVERRAREFLRLLPDRTLDLAESEEPETDEFLVFATVALLGAMRETEKYELPRLERACDAMWALCMLESLRRQGKVTFDFPDPAHPFDDTQRLRIAVAPEWK